jgi:hypothetical protein
MDIMQDIMAWDMTSFYQKNTSLHKPSPMYPPKPSYGVGKIGFEEPPLSLEQMALSSCKVKSRSNLSTEKAVQISMSPDVGVFGW